MSEATLHKTRPRGGRQRPALPDLAPEGLVAPRWLRHALEGDSGFAVGAALAWIEPLARALTAPGGVWRKRQALAVAGVIAQLDGHRADQASLRDHWVLRRDGDDPGPAARIYGGCRWLASERALRAADWATQLPALFGLAPDPALIALLQKLSAALPGRGRAVEEAAAAAAQLVALGPAYRGLALALADVVLARGLGWSAPVPLLATQLKRADLRLAGQGGDWHAACAQAWARAALEAAISHAALRRQAAQLLHFAPKLRGRDAAAGIAALLSEDALAAQAGAETSDRSARRFFERLVAAGVVRELTGRPTFRLYGL